MSDLPNDSIFLVVAEWRDWEDSRSWVAAAFLTEAEAMAAVPILERQEDYQKRVLRGWQIAADRFSQEKYGCDYWTEMCRSKNWKEKRFKWPIPNDSADADFYRVLMVPLNRLGRYWPE